MRGWNSRHAVPLHGLVEVRGLAWVRDEPVDFARCVALCRLAAFIARGAGSEMNSVALPSCRHRGEQIGRERWVCRSPSIFAPLGFVSGRTCRFLCPYVDHDGHGPKAAEGVRGPITIRARLELFALAMITAPRQVPTVNRTIAEARRAGFVQRLRVFAEPGSAVESSPGVEIVRNPVRLGMWPNWRKRRSISLSRPLRLTS